jgi:preprotein translocase subunit SecG
MAWLNTLLIVIEIFCAVTITILILLQHGKGADMGAAFGSGASGSLFGASGSANFLSRTTAILASVFFITTIALAYVATNMHPTAGRTDQGGIMSGDKGATTPAAPAQGSGPADIPSGAAPPAGAAAGTPTAPAPTPANTPSNRPADIPK